VESKLKTVFKEGAEEKEELKRDGVKKKEKKAEEIDYEKLSKEWTLPPEWVGDLEAYAVDFHNNLMATALEGKDVQCEKEKVGGV
jgi:hypothetical protein